MEHPFEIANDLALNACSYSTRSGCKKKSLQITNTCQVAKWLPHSFLLHNNTWRELSGITGMWFGLDSEQTPKKHVCQKV